MCRRRAQKMLRRGSTLGLCVRALEAIVTGGVLLQTSPGGCSQALDNFVSTVGQDITMGIGTGFGNLAQALVLNLFT